MVEFATPPRQAPSPPHVFIAYNFQDQDFVHMLAPALRRTLPLLKQITRAALAVHEE